MNEGGKDWNGAPFDDPAVRAGFDLLYEGVYFVDLDRRIRFWNAAAARITGWPAADMVGRCCSDGMLNHVDDTGTALCANRCPLAAAMQKGEPAESRIYLHHRQGHRQAVRVRVLPIRDCEGRVVGALEAFEAATTPERLERLERLAFTDPLTGLANRRYLDQVMEARRLDLARQGWPFGVLLVDVDTFKQVNDTFGHAEGDRVLRMVAHSLTAAMRPSDIVGRYGGDEFLAVVQGINHRGLESVANRVRALVGTSSLPHADGPVSVTVSVGAAMARTEDTLETLLSRADTHLNASKVAGRDRVTSDRGG